jgi:hypothetical protein
MKKLVSLFIIAVFFSSCQEDLQTNNPGFQGLKDDVLWRSNDTRAYVSPTGALTIEAQTEYENVTLNTSSISVGKYVLGTTNAANLASYSSNFNDVSMEYATEPVPGQVYSVTLVNTGSGYTSDCDLQTNNQYVCDSAHNTTGGSGSGLTVAIVANAAGLVTSVVRVVARGNGYLPGDIVTVTSGNLNCKVRVENVQNSNGEIEITAYDNVNQTVTGKFKFNAVNTNNNPFAEPIVNFQYGEFYKIPIYPSL